MPSKEARHSILVVDDDPTFCQIMNVLLRRAGYAVQLAFSADEAMALMKKAVPDLILADIMMPEVDGLSFLRRLRAEPIWSSIPVIVVSARVMDSERDAARRAGANAFIGKPFSIQRLRSTIESCLPMWRN